MWSDLLLGLDSLIVIGLVLYFNFYVLPRIKP